MKMDTTKTQAIYEDVSKSFRTGRLERGLQMVQLSATRCSCIVILWVSLVSFAAITVCVASRRVFVIVVSLSTQTGNFWIHPRTSPVDVDRWRFIWHWKDRTFPLQTMWNISVLFFIKKLHGEYIYIYIYTYIYIERESNDRRQGLSNIYSNLRPSEKWALKRQYKTKPLQSTDYVRNDLCVFHLGFCGGRPSLKSQRVPNKVLRTTGNLPRRTPTRDLRAAFKIPYIYDFVTKLCRQQVEVITKSWKCKFPQDRPKRSSIQKILKVSYSVAVRHTTVQAPKLLLYPYVVCIRCDELYKAWTHRSGVYIDILCTYLLTYLLTPWCRKLFEKLIITQLVENALLSYGTRRFVTVFTKARHWTYTEPAESSSPHRSLSP
jgi:hypothetical protein